MNALSAVGNVQIYYNGSVLEANKVVYDQKTKRLRAEGNAKLTEAKGQVTYGEIMDLSDDYRDGFVDSLRVDSAEQTSIAAARPTVPPEISRSSTAAFTPPANPAGTIRKSLRSGRSEPPASSTIRARR
jgi:Organic solvent tolerance protein OstA